MTGRQKIYGGDGAPRSSGSAGLRTIFDKFRTTKRPQRDSTVENKRRSQAQEDMPSMRALRSRNRQSKTPDPRVAGGASGTIASESAGASTESSSPNFFSRLLRRQTRRKTQPGNLPNRGKEAAPLAEQTITAYNENADPRGASRHRARDSTGRESDRPSYSRIDAKINPGESKRQSQVYVPAHAAADFSRVPVSQSLKDRYSTLIDQEDNKRLSAMLAQLSPPRVVEDGRIRSYISEDDYYRDEQRRLTIATLEGSNYTDSSLGVNQETIADNTLQPPPIPSRRRPKRHSYVPAEEPRQISEEPTVPSDYQRFIQQALDRDRQEHDEMWHAILGRPGRKSVTPVHPDLMNHGSLQRSGTFGGSRKERSASKKRDNAHKRSSHYSYQSRDSRKRRSHIGGETNNDFRSDTPPRDLRKQTSAARRLSDYLKPPRAAGPNPTAEEHDSKRRSRASFR